jgi:hypothetical protein
VLEEIVLDTKEIDVHRIITTSFNVQLNTFIANFEEKKPSFEEVRTGGLTEIRVHRGTTTFNAYAYFLKKFREDLFRNSINWRFPISSFISNLDNLVSFYTKTFDYSYDYTAEELNVLYDQLIMPLSRFLESIDQEFVINHFGEKIIKLQNKFLKLTRKTQLAKKEIMVLPLKFSRLQRH